MKRTFIINILLLSFPALTLAQSQPTPSSLVQDSRVKQVDELCTQVKAIIQGINYEYEKYKNDTVHFEKLYKSGLAQTFTFNKLKKEVKDTREKIKTINKSIDEIKLEIAWVDTLTGYYKSHQLDQLFDVIDWPTLLMHKRLLGNNAPKALNDLLVMNECYDLLKREYDERANEECINLLKTVANCNKKKSLMGLLETHSAIMSETNGWSSKEHSLYDLMDFRKYLHEEYGVNLEKDYPFLANKARKTVIFGQKQNNP